MQLALIIRNYSPDDYPQVAALYRQPDLYGGQFSEDRDSQARLSARIAEDPSAVLVAEKDNHIIGTVSLIEDARVAWLFRFAVKETEEAAAVCTALQKHACDLLRARGHHEVLVYSPVGNSSLTKRYLEGGFTQGGDYSCFWKTL